MKKKVLAVILGVSMVMSMTACGGSSDSAKENGQSTETSEGTDAADVSEEPEKSEESADTEGSADSYKIAIVKQMDHASLDEIANAIAAQFDAIEKEKGVDIEYEIYSGQG